jgi:hypothetical protein
MKRLFLLLLVFFQSLALGQSTAIIDGAGLANGKSYTNYIKNPNAQKNVANVTTTAGSTIARVSSATALYDKTEFSITDAGAWDAVWSTMPLNGGMKNRLCEVQMLVLGTVTGTTTLKVIQNAVDVFSQDVSSIISATNPKKIGGTFPCGDGTYATTVALAGSAATTALKAGAVCLGEPVSVSSGTISTPEAAYTAAAFGGQGTLAITQNELKWWRVGQHIFVRGRVTIGAGAGAAATFTIPFPFGLTLTTGGVVRQVAQATFYDASGGTQMIAIPSGSAGDSGFGFTKTGGGSIQGSDLGASDELTFTAGPFAVSGWAATDIVTPEQSLPSVARTYRSGSGLTITAGTPLEVIFNTERADTKSEFNTTTGRFTAISTGWYAYDYGITLTAGATAPTLAYFGVRVNGAGDYLSSAYVTDLANSKSRPTTASGVVYLTAGQYISLWANTAGQNGTIEYSSNEYSYFHVRSSPSPGSQSFYLSSPLVAPPDGTGIKLKSSTNTDVLTVSDAGAAVITATSGVGLIVKGSGTTSSSSNQIWRASDNTTLGYVENGGAWTLGPSSGSTQVSHTVYGYSNAITWGNGTFNVSNRNGSNAATIVFANGTTKISNWASSSTYPFSAANSGGADTIAVHANGIYGYNAGTMRAVGVTSGNVLGDTTVSKRDLKKNIVDSKYGLKTATLLKMREFDWKASGQHDIGAIADEVADVAPILAYFGKDGVAEGVNYTKLAVVAIKAIQEQQVQIACLVNADTKKQRQACVK